jgi:predicted acyltransferase
LSKNPWRTTLSLARKGNSYQCVSLKWQKSVDVSRNEIVTAAQPSLLRPAASGTSDRLMSLDALRGFDMFWIVGAEALVHALNNFGKNEVTEFLSTQLTHVPWTGFHFYDLIFPMFVFIAGVSMVFSMNKAILRYGRCGALLRLGRRCALLVLLGLFYYGGFSYPWPQIRLTGVLQLFGVACFLAGSIFIAFPRRPHVLVGALLTLLATYWMIMTLVPFPDIRLNKDSLARLAGNAGSIDPSVLARSVSPRVHGVFEEGYNLANYVDYRYLPGKKLYGDGNYEAQGLFQMVAATSTCLLGILAGLWLSREDLVGGRKVIGLLGAGTASVVLGWLLGLHFPVVKKLWSPTFVLVAGGYTAMLLGFFYYVVEVRKKTWWCQPFVWIGMNSITIYLAYNIISFPELAARFAGGDVQRGLDTQVAHGTGGLLMALVEVMLMLLLVRLLYVRKIFIRL